MKKNVSYVEKFESLEKFIPSIITDIKKDLKNEHIKDNLVFLKKYFQGKVIKKISLEELISVYAPLLIDKDNEDLAAFVANRWILQNSDVYDLF